MCMNTIKSRTNWRYIASLVPAGDHQTLSITFFNSPTTCWWMLMGMFFEKGFMPSRHRIQKRSKKQEKTTKTTSQIMRKSLFLRFWEWGTSMVETHDVSDGKGKEGILRENKLRFRHQAVESLLNPVVDMCWMANALAWTKCEAGQGDGVRSY